MKVLIDDATLEAEIKRQQLNRGIPPSIFPIEFTHKNVGLITTNIYATIFRNAYGDIEVALIRDNTTLFTLLSSEESPAETAIKLYNRINRLFED